MLGWQGVYIIACSPSLVQGSVVVFCCFFSVQILDVNIYVREEGERGIEEAREREGEREKEKE